MSRSAATLTLVMALDRGEGYLASGFDRGKFMERHYGNRTWDTHAGTRARMLVVAGAMLAAVISFFLLR